MAWLQQAIGTAEDFLNNLDAQAEKTIAQQNVTKPRGQLNLNLQTTSMAPNFGTLYRRTNSETIKTSSADKLNQDEIIDDMNSFGKLNGSLYKRTQSITENRDIYNLKLNKHNLLVKNGASGKSSRKTSFDSDYSITGVVSNKEHYTSNNSISNLKEIGDVNIENVQEMEKVQLIEQIQVLNQQIENFKNSIHQNKLRHDSNLEAYINDIEILKETCFDQKEQIDQLYMDNEAKSSKLEQLTTELSNTELNNSNLLNESTYVNDLHQSAIETIEDKLLQAEKNLKSEILNRTSLEKQLEELRSNKIEDQIEMSKQLKERDQIIASEKRSIQLLRLENKKIENINKSIDQELKDYKDKAARILKSKTRLISNYQDDEMRRSGGLTKNPSSEPQNLSDQLQALTIQLEEIRHEKEEILSKYNNIKQKLNDIEIQYSELEQQMSKENDELATIVEDLKSNNKMERNLRQEAEQEVGRLRKKNVDVQADLTMRTQEYTSRLQERDSDICKLRNQLLVRSKSGPNENELEHRVHSLTDTIIQKQTTIENLIASKHSLTLQLERANNSLEELEKRPNLEDSKIRERRMANSVPVLIDDEDIRLDYHNSGIIKQKAKETLRTIDIFSIRLGVFLKRYPIARIFILVYGILLHIWVMVILLVDEPEVHNPGERFMHYDYNGLK